MFRLCSNTFYYVCQPHVSSGMKGVIIAHHYPVSGCTDSLAFNYDSLATVDDGSCSYCLSLNATPSQFISKLDNKFKNTNFLG